MSLIIYDPEKTNQFNRKGTFGIDMYSHHEDLEKFIKEQFALRKAALKLSNFNPLDLFKSVEPKEAINENEPKDSELSKM